MHTDPGTCFRFVELHMAAVLALLLGSHTCSCNAVLLCYLPKVLESRRFDA